ncbi:glycerophosphodiester phosphodiesterase [Staphylococcus equorum subsp. linens]|uniref:glycerophosphodiester phosphodiesterase n=1 Tax=Staphylococcus equorum TaxID=246432 RepID=UPI000267E2B3|nr:glycerophosphodiester phosphodiesterase [Staphylococcus equorum]MDK9842371.1 glycerophosphodiester phosphodiesterase [Staphylococcus equorum]MDN5637716.1 glycerophosphodiester phosphodiesterase [Staphylococcus equorum]PNZ05853.1 glycerophosphodiester phosphodiesterase [Staphylococcus equorum subsp. linens]QQT18991.1 glycerophosphodiester phosphodiesterase [Staphylococcus equorum]CCI60423.1 putative glycerophosphoryl diester phosphodiesterase [Staphylococcus equorum subsp. equorum Mu2]
MTKINKLIKGGFLSTLGLVVSVFLLTKYKAKPNNQSIPSFFSKPAPYIFAHRGGMAVRPEQTKLAFDNAAAHGIDGFETDVKLTKDRKLIVFHDVDVDRTTNGSGKVSEHTLAEIKQLDSGYHFVDINGHKPYRGHKDAYILSFDELLKLYPNQLINVDLKDDPESEHGHLVPEIIFEDIVANNAQDRVLVTSFHSKQIERFNIISNGTVAIGAGQSEVAEGFLKFYLGLGNSFQPRAHTFQMPVSFKGIKLTSPRFIQWLNTRDIIPGYYDVNNLDLMNDLIFNGAHTLVTDRPDLAERFKHTYH